ncbi:MAG: Hsp20/alpha crystallin family protein [Nitrospirales bacterium]|nr:Hsp20/alpha crystallin family protein [Nitrospirales bacterium]
MTLMKPYASTDVDRLLEETLRTASIPKSWSPASNIYEDAHSFRVEAAVPGFDRQAVEVTFEDSVLTITGQQKEEETESRHYFLREIVPGMFSRSLRMPAAIDATKVTATVKDGVLTVELPKREDTKLRRIQIQ